MAVVFQLPDEVEKRLRTETPDLNVEAKEAYALDLFRRGKLTHCELSAVLGLDRIETNAYLQHHGVLEGSLTMEDLDEQARTLDHVLGIDIANRPAADPIRQAGRL